MRKQKQQEQRHLTTGFQTSCHLDLSSARKIETLKKFIKDSKESIVEKIEVPVQLTCDPQPDPMCASNKEEGGEGTQVD